MSQSLNFQNRFIIYFFSERTIFTLNFPIYTIASEIAFNPNRFPKSCLRFSEFSHNRFKLSFPESTIAILFCFVWISQFFELFVVRISRFVELFVCSNFTIRHSDFSFRRSDFFTNFALL
ncbi:hypothetical protein QL285_020779 [Trifolium repens]|nr:hypothetical protein QL285_020779 [Trifolium repens]